MATPRSGAPLRLHSRCELTNYGRGEVLFVGQASFSPGVWVGIALDEPLGKNDGSVQGKRYFETQQGYGVFVRASQVRVLEEGEEETVDDVEEEQDASQAVYQDDEENLLGDEEPSPVEEPQRRQSARAPPSSAPRSAAARPIAARPAMTASQRATPIDGRASSAAQSSRSSSPAKRGTLTPGLTGRASAVRPSSVASSSVRPRAPASASPQKLGAPATSAPRASPFQTPARAGIARPGTSQSASAVRPAVTRASTAGSRSSLAPSPAIGARSAQTPRPDSSASMRTGRIPATTTAAARTTTTTQARQAVRAAQAPDTATARAGLRSVAKTRTSMAPPTSVTPRTPAAGRIGADASVGARQMPPPTTVPRRAAGGALASTASTPRSSGADLSSPFAPSPRSADTRRHDNEDDEDEDLMSMDAKEELNEALAESVDDSGPGSPASPSLRKAHGEQVNDHMSLTRGPSMTSIARNNAEMTAMQRELEETRARLRISEKKRDEEREQVRKAEAMRQESEQILAVKPKLVAKQEELQNELKDLHRQEREWTVQKEETERQLAELTDQVEILSLDKEFAEEKAEGAAEELQLLKDRVEELELDLEVQREELARYDQEPVDGESKDRSSVAVVQLEKQNERLKDALIRLRDITAENDAEQKQRIAEQEKELRSLDEIQASYESTTAKLQVTEALLEDLKIQLDDALGAEEMLEQLSERNMAMSEKITEMQAEIEELESLKELNDELEETHIETEKQLQEEVDLKELQIRELHARTESLEANLVDYETTFSQFRELVLNLQSENEALRDDEKLRDASKATNNAEDQAMLNLNLKLQSSTLKSQAKTIELELGKLDAAQAQRQIYITSTYLPRKYFEQDKDAVDSLLFFQRLASKTDIVKTIVEGSNDIASNLVGVIDERLIGVCLMRHSVAHFTASARQISALVQLATIPTFLKSGRMFKELSSIERRIDHFIDLLRREELKEDECAIEYRRFVKMLEDYEFALLDGSSEAPDNDLAAKELGSATLFELDLDTISAALGYSKQIIASFYNDYNKQVAQAADLTSLSVPQAPGEGELQMHLHELDIDQCLFAPLQDLINHSRSAKVPARKLVRRLTTLHDNDEAVKMDAIVRLPGLGKLSSELVTFASTLAKQFAEYVGNVRTNKTAFDLKDVLTIVEEVTHEALDATLNDGTNALSPTHWSLASQETAHLNRTVTDLLNAATEQDNVIRVAGEAPWSLRAGEMRDEQSQNAETQRVILKQTEDLRDLYKQIKARDEVIEENRIKIERLAKSLQRSRQDNETVGVLRDDLTDVTKRMKAYQEGNSALQTELEQLQRQYEQLLSQKGSAARAADATVQGAEGITASDGTPSGIQALIKAGSTTQTLSSVLPSSNFETSYLVDQLEALQGALRYLRLENSMLRGRDLIAQVESLPVLASRRWSPAMTTEEAAASTDQASEDDGFRQRGLPKSKKEGRTGQLGSRHRPQQSIADVRRHAESKSLKQEWMRVASSPRVVMLPALKAPLANDKERGEQGPEDKSVNTQKRRGWVPLAQLPHVQYRTQLQERARLRQRIEALATKNRQGHLPAVAQIGAPLRI